jgi:hypothetical protein
VYVLTHMPAHQTQNDLLDLGAVKNSAASLHVCIIFIAVNIHILCFSIFLYFASAAILGSP